MVLMIFGICLGDCNGIWCLGWFRLLRIAGRLGYLRRNRNWRFGSLEGLRLAWLILGLQLGSLNLPRCCAAGETVCGFRNSGTKAGTSARRRWRWWGQVIRVVLFAL